MSDYFDKSGTESDIYILKMTNGLTILSQIEFIDDDGEYYKLIKPLEFVRSLEGNEVVTGFFPWLYGAKVEETIIHSMDVMTMFEADDDMISTFNQLNQKSKVKFKGPLTGLDNPNHPFNPWKDRMN